MEVIRGTDADGEPENEADNFYICEICGQAVDMRHLEQVLHHEKEGHEPIPPQA